MNSIVKSHKLSKKKYMPKAQLRMFDDESQAYQELTFQGMELMSATYLTFEVWITITALYLVLTLSFSLGVERLERYMRRATA